MIHSDCTLKLRLHSLNGALVRDCSNGIAPAYGYFRIFDQKVSICISSGPTNVSPAYTTPGHLRLGSHIHPRSINDLSADQILEWDTTSGASRRINIITATPTLVKIPHRLI